MMKEIWLCFQDKPIKVLGGLVPGGSGRKIEVEYGVVVFLVVLVVVVVVDLVVVVVVVVVVTSQISRSFSSSIL